MYKVTFNSNKFTNNTEYTKTYDYQDLSYVKHLAEVYANFIRSTVKSIIKI